MEASIQLAAPNDIDNGCTSALETSMMEKLDKLFAMSPSRCIYRVPHRLRSVCEKAYTPQVVSIGPLHHGKETLKAMEEQKWRYLRCFIRRNNLSLKDCIKIVRDQETRLRSCYSEAIELQSDELISIILVDAVFIIEFLLRYSYLELRNENDCIFGTPKMIDDVWPDLVMLENQLPFFILEHLFGLNTFLAPSEDTDTLDFGRLSILHLCHQFLNQDVRRIGGTLDNLKAVSEEEVQHLVDFFRKLYIAPLFKPQSAGQPKQVTAPSIEELHRAGVKFKFRSTKNLFDIRFKDGILEIPKLEISDSTELILRNLIAFEQCIWKGNYISDYVGIMDQFVNTPKDVELLVHYGIVEHMLGGGNDELCTMINSLTTEVKIYPTKFYYGTVCEDLNKFCSLLWHKRMANLRHNYFNTPWKTISFIAAVFLLIFTAVQTICSIISLKP
ncbi:hypothetical protein RchiOBHm_Chr7g0225421 [Rosa chinensis]|uniref:DUF247 domain protein n=2 Tax=Rosa chinensis TaxID=74649 RepID=A0A2P6PE45_ROSCH|nr:UPF0481 protein At3g47200 isoform X2 [Rosa chinensis]XP_040365767.1 UPF0481 protein At3g47200 isoform X2 [Rosa chinensis]PRQ20189.1 hypothetical protein RchiOBHm_Chr7g0225421 [Rosa chinensis]